MTGADWLSFAVSAIVGTAAGILVARIAIRSTERRFRRDEFDFRLVDQQGDVLISMSSTEAPLMLRYGYGAPEDWSELDHWFVPQVIDARPRFLTLQGRLRNR